MAFDGKALRILRAAYRHHPPTPPNAADLAYAKAHDVMFDAVTLNHDGAVAAVIAARKRVTLRAVSDAFIASLSTRRLESRAAFASFVVARHLAKHAYAKWGNGGACRVCNFRDGKGARQIDRSEMNHSRLFQGSIYGLDPAELAFCLERFSVEEQDPPRAQDFDILNGLFRVIREVQRHAGDGKAHRAEVDRGFGKLLPSSKYEREAIFDALGYAEVLAPPELPGFRARFIPVDQRQERGSANGEWDYPVGNWRAIDGVNLDAVSEWFAQPEVERIASAPPAVEKGLPAALRALHPLFAEALAALPAADRPARHLGLPAPALPDAALLALARAWPALVRDEVPEGRRESFDRGVELIAEAAAGKPIANGPAWGLSHDGAPTLNVAGFVLRAHTTKGQHVLRVLRSAVKRVVTILPRAQATAFVHQLDAALGRAELVAAVAAAAPLLDGARLLHRDPAARVWVARLADGSYVSCVGRDPDARLTRGGRDDVLAAIPDTLFAPAVEMTLVNDA